MTAHRSDIIVLGAGTIGLFTALNLARCGRRVVVLERAIPWSEASGVNAGSLGVQNKLTPLVPYAIAAFAIWEDLARQLGCDIGYHRTGGYKIAMSPEQEDRLRASFDAQRDAGLDAQWKTARELRDEAPWLSDAVVAASFCESDGHASPICLGPALVEAVRREQVRLVEGVQILNIEAAGSVSIESTGETFAADELVIATGAWSGRVAAMLGVTLPVSLDVNMVSVTEPAPLTVGKIVTHAHGILTVKQVANGCCLIGGGWQGIGTLDSMAKEIDFDQLIHNLILARQALPGLSRLHLLRSWAGYEGVSPDSLPYLGRLPGRDNIYMAACARGGFTLAPLLGKLLAELIVEGRASMAIDDFNPGRFAHA